MLNIVSIFLRNRLIDTVLKRFARLGAILCDDILGSHISLVIFWHPYLKLLLSV